MLFQGLRAGIGVSDLLATSCEFYRDCVAPLPHHLGQWRELHRPSLRDLIQRTPSC
jgi:hypothetical protein